MSKLQKVLADVMMEEKVDPTRKMKRMEEETREQILIEQGMKAAILIANGVKEKKSNRNRYVKKDVVHGCKISEIIFPDKGATGLVIEPYCITFESLPGKMQTFWVGMVMAIDQETRKKLKLTGVMGDKIKPGDIVLYVNTFMCMVDRSQARNGVEFCQALRDVIMNAVAPRAIRLARCR